MEIKCTPEEIAALARSTQERHEERINVKQFVNLLLPLLQEEARRQDRLCI